MIKLLIVDDHVVVREGLKAMLNLIEDMQVVAEAENGLQAIAAYETYQPDVVIMDLVMPEMDGVEAIKTITEKHPKALILALTSFSTDHMVFSSIKAGAIGYLLKNTPPEELLNAIRQVQNGNFPLSPEIAKKVLNELGGHANKNPTPEPLTEREHEVLIMLATGMGNSEIAEKMVVAPVTVRTHVSRILAKLHLANRVQATLYALREGIVSFPSNEETEI